MANNPSAGGRCKHIDIKTHFVRDHISKRHVMIKYTPTAKQVADIFTKALPNATFTKLKKKLFGYNPYTDESY